jgi:cellulose synthase operon protein C
LNLPRPHALRSHLRNAFFTALVSLLGACGGEVSSDVHVKRAQALRDKGDLRAAWIEVRNAIVQDPKHAEARRLMGELQLGAGAPAEAEKELRKAMELGLAANTLDLALGRSLLLQNKLDEVLELVTQGLDDSRPATDRAVLLALKGQALYALAKREEATEALTAALALDPECSEAVLGQSMVLVTRNEVTQAKDLLSANLKSHPGFAPGWNLLGDIERVSGNVDAAIEAYTQAAKNRSNNIIDLIKRGLALTRKGDLDAALKDAGEISRRLPKHPGGDYIKGLVALARNQPADARTALMSALNKAPDYSPAKLYLALTQRQLGEFQQAETTLMDVVKEMPGSADARKLLAGLRLRRGDYAGVVDAVSPLNTPELKDRTVLELLGTAHFGLGKGDEAAAYFERAAVLAPDSGDAQTRMGLALLAGGETERGLASLDSAIEMVPESAESRGRLVSMMLRARDLDRALKTAQHFVEVGPNEVVNHQLLAVVLRARGDKEGAYAEFEKVLALQPADATANHGLAELDIGAQQYAKARQHYEAVLKAVPEHERTVLKLAELDSLEGKLDAARDRLEAHLKLKPESLGARTMLAQYWLGTGAPLKAQRLLEEVRAQHERNPNLLLLLAISLMDQQQPAAAVPLLETLTGIVPGSAEFQYRLSQAYAGAGDSIKSQTAIEQAIRLAPEHIPSLVARFRGLELSGKHEEARQFLALMQERFPDNTEVIAQAGWFASRSANSAEAVASLQKAYAAQPTASIARDLASAQFQLGQLDAGLATLRSWLEQNPADTATRTLLALTLASNNKSEESLDEFRAVIERDPNNADALNNLAWFLIGSAPAEALEMAERAHTAKPEDASITDTLARALTATGDHRRAVQLLRDVLLKSPRSTSARISLANALLAAGQKDEARTQVEAVLAEAPDNADAKALLQKL